MNELDVLIELARHQPENIQNASQTMLADLQQRGLVKDDLTLTEAGYAYLEPYRVKRAVLIAAGFGSRMVPLTYTTPKPLIKVHGRRIIETLLDALLAAGIEEIIICRGYLKETFDVLKDKYPMIQFVEKSRRNIPLERAVLIMKRLDPSILPVAVTVCPEKEQLRRIEEAGFGAVQIHGSIPEMLLDGIRIPVIKAFNVGDLSDYGRFCGDDRVAGFIFDAQTPGSGKTFDWSLLGNIPAGEKPALIAVLPAARRDKVNPFLRKFMYELNRAGTELLRASLEKCAVQVACNQFDHIEILPEKYSSLFSLSFLRFRFFCAGNPRETSISQNSRSVKRDL